MGRALSTLTTTAAVAVVVAMFSGQALVAKPAALSAGGGEGGAATGAGDFGSCGGPLADAPDQYAALFKASGDKHGVDPQILAGIAKKESNFTPSARNASSGASGMMQFMPATAAGLGIDPMVPEQAVDGAARLYKTYLGQFGSLPKALAAYNAGPANVQKYGGVPPFAETQTYVRTIEGWLRTAKACGPPSVQAGRLVAAPSGPPSAKVATYMSWAQSKVGGPYVFGGNGPVGFDCSSFVLTALRQVGVEGMPRVADAQDAWCAAGNCTAIPIGQERRGDIFVWDSYLGPNTVAHIGFVDNPAKKTTVDARSTSQGIIVGSYAHHESKNIFRIWRPKV